MNNDIVRHVNCLQFRHRRVRFECFVCKYARISAHKTRRADRLRASSVESRSWHSRTLRLTRLVWTQLVTPLAIEPRMPSNDSAITRGEVFLLTSSLASNARWYPFILPRMALPIVLRRSIVSCACVCSSLSLSLSRNNTHRSYAERCDSDRCRGIFAQHCRASSSQTMTSIPTVSKYARFSACHRALHSPTEQTASDQPICSCFALCCPVLRAVTHTNQTVDWNV